MIIKRKKLDNRVDLQIIQILDLEVKDFKIFIINILRKY